MRTDAAARLDTAARVGAVTQVEIVVPVRNEERDLTPGVRRLVAFLRDGFPFTARVTVADNGSTDGTWAVARSLAAEFGEVRAVHVERPGRGRALHARGSRVVRGPKRARALLRPGISSAG